MYLKLYFYKIKLTHSDLFWERRHVGTNLRKERERRQQRFCNTKEKIYKKQKRLILERRGIVSASITGVKKRENFAFVKDDIILILFYNI